MSTFVHCFEETSYTHSALHKPARDRPLAPKFAPSRQSYYRARYYDPSTGRFLNEDTLGFNSDDLNLHRYVANSPIGYNDPSGNRKFDCGARCSFRLETDPFKGKHINWKCNGLSGCLLWPSLQIYEKSKSDLPPKRLRDCIDDKLNKPKSCPKTDFEYQKEEESNRYMERFWDWILVGDAALAVVGTAGAFGWLGGGTVGAGGAGAAPKPIPFPKPAPPIPIPVKPAA